MAKQTLRVVQDQDVAELAPGVSSERVTPDLAPETDPVDAPLPVPPAAPGEAEELLGDLLRALLDLPSLSNADDPKDSRWGDIAAKLPDELFERLDRWMETRSADAEVG